MTNRFDIIEQIKGKDDFTRLDLLKRYLKNADSLDTRKFIYLQMAQINEGKKFYIDAAKNIDAAAEMSLTFKEKEDYYMKEADLLVRGGDFILADKIFLKAVECAKNSDKPLLKSKYILFYFNEAEHLIKTMQNRKAAILFERLMSMELSFDQKLKVKDKLLNIYEKGGKIREYNTLKAREIKDPNKREEKKIEQGSFEDLGIRRL